MNYKKMSFISGIVIFFSIVIIMISILTLSGKRIMFSSDYIIYVKFSDVIGLQDQAKVFMRGYRVGWTKDVEFVDDGVVVRIDIKKRFKIPKDSKFEINTISLLGEKAVTIHPGTSKEYLAQGDHIVGTNKDMVIQMRQVLESFKKDLDKGDVAARIKDLSEAVTTLKTVLNKLDKKIEKFDVNRLNQSIAELNKAGQSVSGFMNKNSDSLSLAISNFKNSMQEIGVLSKKLNQIAEKINKGEGSAGLAVNDKTYIQKFDSTLTEINTLIKDLKKNPKKYIDLSIF